MPAPACSVGLCGIIHIELDGAGHHAEAVDLLDFELDIGVDLVVGEHCAFSQERAAGVELVDGLVQRAADRRDFPQLNLGKIVQVFVDRIARMDAVAGTSQKIASVDCAKNGST
jgi:hypothetical protein